MSRPNKVNPGMYTQRGRLTQDDAARELRKQSAIASPHTWQPMNTKTRRRLAPAGDAAHGTERAADNETMVETLPEVEPASRATRNMTAAKAAPSNAKVKTAKAKTAKTRQSKRTTGEAKTGKATATRRTTTKPRRKAALARSAGGGGAAQRPTAKRRKTGAIRRSQE